MTKTRGRPPRRPNHEAGPPTALDTDTGEQVPLQADLEDWPFLSQFRATTYMRGAYREVTVRIPTMYARSQGWAVGSTRSLARVLLGVDDPLVIVDHINRDTLDNRRANLRPVNARQNNTNRGGVNPVSGYRGVCWRKQKNRWQARIKVNGKQVYSSMHEDPADAARAYDVASELHHGEHGLTNRALGLLPE